MHIVSLAVLLSVVGATWGTERELLFPIVTHVGKHRSTMFVLNPSSKYRVSYSMEARSPYVGGTGIQNTLEPNSIAGFGANFDFTPSDLRGGWGYVRYRFLGVPDADKERVKNLRLLAWTELILLKRDEWIGNPKNSVISVANIPATESALEFRVPGILRGEPGTEVAIAILNPSEDPIQIEVTLFYNPDAPEGVQVKNTSSVPPMSRLSRFLWELMTEGKDDPPERPTHSSRSTLRIQGSAPIAVGALLYYPNGVFGNLPVVRVDQQ